MEQKKQNVLVLLIALIIVVAVFSSFGMNLIPPKTATLEEMTPPPAATPEQTASAGEVGLTRLTVTPETVQDVVATLSRPEAYSRNVLVTYAGATGPISSSVQVSGGRTRADVSYPNGILRHTLIAGDTLYTWYGSGSQWVSGPADERSADLEGPHIPTYEDVLTLDPSSITDAYYPAQSNGEACIYVAWTGEAPGEWGCYYISVEPDSLGLLAQAKLYQGEEEVLSMVAASTGAPEATASTFLLPDGTDPMA